jgi:NAD(P)-dependent dehydrogenase (short-subunit alcohol dehydrogenase family)
MKEKVAIVTGGTGALGRAVVEKFANEGITVYVPALSLEEFNEVFDSSKDKQSAYYKLRKLYCFVCNATDEDSVTHFVGNVSLQEKAKIDFLINTVGGYMPPSNVIDISSEALNKMIDLNFKSTFYFTREVLKIMKNNSYGRIVSIGASGGDPVPGRFSYSFSKMGVSFLMDSVSEEMKELNIRCNTIIPNIMDTPANREWGRPEEIKKWVKTEEVAEVIYNLVSDEFSVVRGSHIKVFGSH